MKSTYGLSRRSFLASSALAAVASASAQSKRVPVGLEMYSVRDEMQKDVVATVLRVGKMGYQGVEFYSPYMQWTPDYTKQVRGALNETGMKCWSTHNSASSFTPENIQKAIDLNGILGSTYVVMASAGRVDGLDGWKKVAERLTEAQQKLSAAKMKAGFHNHALEFRAIDGKRPMEVLAANTPKDVMLQLDVGTAIEVGVDPVAWINANPGRIKSLHCKDWSKDKGYRVLFAEGEAKWKDIFATAEKTGGVEFYLIEQEGSDFNSIETAEKCLANYKKLVA
jgi:sugar phosphate isomerase/epimerase